MAKGDLDWASVLGPLAGAAGPLLGGLVGGPAGAAVGAVVGKGLAAALGTEDTPEAVAEAVQKDPAKAEAAVKQIAADPVLMGRLTAEEAAVKRAEIAAADTQDARRHEMALWQAGAKVAWSPAIISVLIVVLFAAVTGAHFWKAIPENSNTQLLIGCLIANFTQVVSYWLGSSAGSREKDDTIRASMQSKVTMAAEAVGAAVGAAVRKK